MSLPIGWNSRFPPLQPAASTSASDATRQLLSLLDGSPRRPHEIDWDVASRTLSTDLPSDYRALCDEFGPGAYWEILVAAPGPDSPFDLLAFAGEAAELQTSVAPDRPRRYPLFPQAGGALTWGRTADAVYLAWVTEGAADAWTVAIIDQGTTAEYTYWLFEGSMSQLLLDVMTGSLQGVPLLLEDDEEPEATFDPY